MNQRDISRLILQEPPLQVLPSLACAIGLNEAIVLQQLYWLLRFPENGKRIAEKQWIFNTYEEWRTRFFPFWNEKMIKRTFARLAAMNLIETCQPEGSLSRRKYYRVNEEALLKLEIPVAPARNSRRGQIGPFDGPNRAVPLTERTSEIQSEESKETSAVADAPVFAAQWQPIIGTKRQKLARLRTPAASPSEAVFDAFLESEGLDNIIEYRPDLYATLSDVKWHQWREGLEKWVPIRDWRAYVTAFNETLNPGGGF